MSATNVVMITFDCLRPDRLCFNGYRGVETPAFDSLAEESLVFERAYCQTPNTWVAHASLFTGTYPARHGVRTPRSGISPDVGTLAEALSDAGYETHGLPAVGMLRSELGFGRGFDTYTLEGTRGPKLRYDNPQYRPAARSLQMAKERIENARRPFFLWIHHFGIHWIAEDALALPAEYRDRFSEYAQFYDGKVSFADAALLRPLIAYLKEADLWDETAIVLLSDHGENLDWVESRRGRSAHNFDLREEAIRTLLMIRLKSGRPAGRRADIANQVDVLPTICEICGVEPPRTNQGRSLLSSDREGEGTAAYVECLCQGCVGVVRNRRKLVLVMDSIHGPRPVWAAKGARKLLHSLKRRTLRAVGYYVVRPNSWWLTARPPEAVLQKLLAKGTRRRSIVEKGAIPRESPHEGPFADEAQSVDLIAHHGLSGGGFSSGKKADLGATSRRLEELGYV